MKYVVSSLLALLGIIDFLLFVQFFDAPHWTSLYWQSHLVIGILSVFLIRLLPTRYRIYPYFLFLILPGFGPFGFGFTQFSVVYFEYNQVLLFEYEKYIFYERLLDLESQTSFTSDVKTLSLQDQFLYSQQETKKDMISSMLSGHDSDYSYLLKDSLDDEDFEVTHYAATALNAFENEFEEKISHTRSDYMENSSPQNLIAYIDATEKYLDSKLMDPAVERIIRSDYINLLKKQLILDPDSRITYVKILKSLNVLGNDDTLLRSLKTFMQLYPKDPAGHRIIMHYLYRENKLKKLSNYAHSLTKQYQELPESLETIVYFWTNKGDIS